MIGYFCLRRCSGLHCSILTYSASLQFFHPTITTDSSDPAPSVSQEQLWTPAALSCPFPVPHDFAAPSPCRHPLTISACRSVLPCDPVDLLSASIHYGRVPVELMEQIGSNGSAASPPCRPPEPCSCLQYADGTIRPQTSLGRDRISAELMPV